MYPVSTAFLEAVQRSHRAIVSCEAILDGQRLGELELLSGDVTLDCRREGPLRTLTLSLSPSSDAWSWLTAYGAEVRVRRGIRLAAGDEYVPLGVFVVDADLEESEDGEISVNAADRSIRISRNRWTSPYTVAAGVDVATAASALLKNRWPACPVDMPATGHVLGAQAVFQDGDASDPWRDLRTLTSPAGLEPYFDAEGVARLRSIPDPLTAAPVATYHGGELDVVLGSARTAMLDRAYNGVVVTGEGSGLDTPVRAEAWDEDPTSPTYHLGPMGKVPMFYSSPLISTAAEALSAARKLLAQNRGRVEQLKWAQVVNPAHEPYDVIEYVREAGTSRQMLDQLTIPLAVSDAMNAVARETRRL